MEPTRREVLAGSATAVAGATGALAGCSVPAAGFDARNRIDHTIEGRARIGFAGDVVLGGGVDATHASAPEGVWAGALRDRMGSLDGVVANLETPLTARGEPWPEKASTYRADPDWARAALDAGGVTAVNLANDHALDYGRISLSDTTGALATAGIAHTGAGSDREAAFAPATFEAGDVSVAMVAVTDQFRPFGADFEQSGTAYRTLTVTDPDTRRSIGRALSRISGAVDLIVASLHWGPRDPRRPDGQQRFARWLVERGVDLVYAHGTRRLRGVEVYRDHPICYDVGSFLLDPSAPGGRATRRSFLFELVVDEGLDRLVLHPVETAGGTVRPAGPEADQWLRRRVENRSARFGTQMRSLGSPVRIPL